MNVPAVFDPPAIISASPAVTDRPPPGASVTSPPSAWENQDKIGGMTFLPAFDASFRLDSGINGKVSPFGIFEKPCRA